MTLEGPGKPKRNLIEQFRDALKSGEIPPAQSKEGMPDEDVEALSWVQGRLDEGKRITREKLEAESVTDPMTGLFNRREFEEKGNSFMEELYRNKRKERLQSVAIIFSDIDFFKKVNDTQGHEAGDEVIKAVANVLRRGVRPGDIAVRLGGEELLLLMRNMTPDQAAKKAEELRAAVAALSFPDIDPDFRVTASFGVGFAERGSEKEEDIKEEDKKTLSELLHEADAAVYHAKNSGRNQVKIYEKGVTPEKPQKEDKRKEGDAVA